MWRELRIEMSQDALMATPDPAPEPSELDRALLRAVSDEVAQLPDGVAKLTHAWSYGRGMWFVEVQPHEPWAALLSVAFDGNALLNFTLGNIWFDPAPARPTHERDVPHPEGLSAPQIAVQAERSRGVPGGERSFGQSSLHLDRKQAGPGVRAARGCGLTETRASTPCYTALLR